MLKLKLLNESLEVVDFVSVNAVLIGTNILAVASLTGKPMFIPGSII